MTIEAIPRANISPIVHLVRHGHISDHQTDQPLTAAGRQAALLVGRELVKHIRPGRFP